MSHVLTSLTKSAKWVGLALLGAGIPVGVAYFQVVYHNVEEEAQRLHREGNLYREKIKEEWNLKKQETQ
ncbi:hypothetical protein NCLIV_051610 [Neospora caninum Liverpool]|uniref:Uncharacterized protein n=1 Tax=Neospora caninum (strain Liverpool) TaxID=572307 RepID=F0VKY3_NEOCL|nr:hypothetical protein NCLIV_051610 [Neospora caninum Liverpool]CBZ54735.1 hypothetical protein NCLIV_051610 [Neospora caninum Liverpool]CEL69450.1 TPA: hypothetical protein BN1204_051610 [Neospora caninum Liverpool]|eukprot:XP_003884763.1 hypothetical protein NCLIV_051610 [Neospora caninum Liverpool]